MLAVAVIASLIVSPAAAAEHAVDCGPISFAPGQHDRARGVSLETRELDCSYGYGRGDGRDECRPNGKTRRVSVSVSIQNPKPLRPWERDLFRACAEGSRVDLSSVETAYEYKVVQQGHPGNGDEFVLEPGRRLPTRPDPDGLSFALPEEGPAFLDKWAAEHAGESIEIEFAIKRRRNNWADETLVKYLTKSPVQARYQLDWRHLARFVVPPANYYVEWRFRRLGPGSLNELSEKRRADLPHPL